MDIYRGDKIKEIHTYIFFGEFIGEYTGEVRCSRYVVSKYVVDMTIIVWDIDIIYGRSILDNILVISITWKRHMHIYSIGI